MIGAARNCRMAALHAEKDAVTFYHHLEGVPFHAVRTTKVVGDDVIVNMDCAGYSGFRIGSPA